MREVKEITNKIINSGKVNWRTFQFLQPNNFKDLSKESYQKLRKSIIDNNFVESFKIWQKNGSLYCLDGFHRCHILKELEKEGYKVPKLMPADFLECKNKKEASKLVLIYSSIYARITNEGLYEFIHTQDLKFDELKLEIDLPDFKLDRFEMGYMRDDLKDPALDDIPEPKEAKAKLGDLYQLGRHRLLCGDAIKKEDVERLMDGKKADMVFTDPPYGIDIVKDNNKIGFGNGRLESKPAIGSIGANGIVPVGIHPKITGDDKPFEPQFLLQYSKHHIIWGGNYFASKLPNSSCWIIWDKREEIPSNNFADCEIAWTNFNKPSRIYKQLWSGLLRKGNRNDEGIKRLHPTQKPVGIHFNMLQDFSKDKSTILDLFGGSGTTLIACEKLNRICYMMEIEPYYCDVIIERWQNLTNQKAELIDG